MYAMFQKQSEGLMLLFRQMKDNQKITVCVREQTSSSTYIEVTCKDAAKENLHSCGDAIPEEVKLQKTPSIISTFSCKFYSRLKNIEDSITAHPKFDSSWIGGWSLQPN